MDAFKPSISHYHMVGGSSRAIFSMWK